MRGLSGQAAGEDNCYGLSNVACCSPVLGGSFQFPLGYIEL